MGKLIVKHKRRVAQVLTTLLYNANLPGFIKGGIYKGGTKGVCVPGLNCYSCPAAVGACPLGSLQSALAKKSLSALYVVGFLIVVGVLFGRFICGWACPIGFIQDLLYKIKLPKVKRQFLKLRWIKYAVLAVMVIGVPLVTAYTGLAGVPAFCKYICPAGTLAGAALGLTDAQIAPLLGTMFYIKLAVLGVILLSSLFMYRPFCKFICPLGAMYGIFNRIAVVRMYKDGSLCTGCGLCSRACPMGADPEHDPNSPECIRCGDCIEKCPVKALGYGSVFKSKK